MVREQQEFEVVLRRLRVSIQSLLVVESEDSIDTTVRQSVKILMVDPVIGKQERNLTDSLRAKSSAWKTVLSSCNLQLKVCSGSVLN